MSDFESYLKEVNFEKYLKKLKTKLKNKKVIVYGSGSLFQFIKEKYDLSDINIIGISDMKFTDSQEGQDFLGYKIVPKLKMKSYEPDVVLIATLKYLSILEDFAINVFADTKIKIYPLVKYPLMQMLKDIWSK